MNSTDPAHIEAAVRKRIHEAVAAVSPWFETEPALLDWLPPGDGWTISEILSHITLTSHYLLILIKKGEHKALKIKSNGSELIRPENYDLEPGRLAEAGLFQSFPWHRPEHMDPRTHAPDWPIQQRFLEQMQECEETLDRLSGGWGFSVRTTMTVNEIGKLDVYQYIVFLCNHALRHCTQMKATLLAHNDQRPDRLDSAT